MRVTDCAGRDDEALGPALSLHEGPVFLLRGQRVDYLEFRANFRPAPERRTTGPRRMIRERRRIEGCGRRYQPPRRRRDVITELELGQLIRGVIYTVPESAA